MVSFATTEVPCMYAMLFLVPTLPWVLQWCGEGRLSGCCCNTFKSFRSKAGWHKHFRFHHFLYSPGHSWGGEACLDPPFSSLPNTSDAALFLPACTAYVALRSNSRLHHRSDRRIASDVITAGCGNKPVLARARGQLGAAYAQPRSSEAAWPSAIVAGEGQNLRCRRPFSPPWRPNAVAALVGWVSKR
jgi:hypothetical protein